MESKFLVQSNEQSLQLGEIKQFLLHFSNQNEPKKVWQVIKELQDFMDERKISYMRSQRKKSEMNFANANSYLLRGLSDGNEIIEFGCQVELDEFGFIVYLYYL